LSGVLIALTVLCGGVARAVSEPTTSRSGDPRHSSTTATASVTSTTTSVPWHFEGRHSGIEHLQVHTKLCPVLDHHLHETFTLTDGAVWNFRAHYCGTIDAHGIWTGVGSFAITTSSGSTLVGTFTDSAQLPTVGVPYELDITTGTGAFARASGSCSLDNHLRTLANGAQHQEGIFVCDLDH
jgi:hypothetical protein